MVRRLEMLAVSAGADDTLLWWPLVVRTDDELTLDVRDDEPPPRLGSVP